MGRISTGRAGSLVERLQGIIERTYDLQTGVRDIGRFLIGDTGYRHLYERLDAMGRIEQKVGALAAGASGTGARTLLRESDGALAVTVYYPDHLIACLERNDPTRRLDDGNVDAFNVLVEELDHLLVIAERYRSQGVTSLLDLELHANVTKYLVLKLFVGRMRRVTRLSETDAAWIRWHLFEKAEFVEPDPQVRERYREASRFAARYVRALDSMPSRERPAELRRFHRMPPQSKIAHITALAG